MTQLPQYSSSDSFNCSKVLNERVTKVGLKDSYFCKMFKV